MSKFNELKLGKELRFIIYKLSDDNKEIIVEETSNDPDWEVFRKMLVNAKSKDKRGNEGAGPRYAVYDFEYELSGGDGKRWVNGSVEFSSRGSGPTVKDSNVL